MTHTRQYADREGDFSAWKPCGRTCAKTLDDGKPCGAEMLYRAWESHDGSYEDYQYRCEVGHITWIDGIDS